MYKSEMNDTTSNAVPAFLTKLWALVGDPINADLISWDESGKSFHVYDQARFSKEVLPLYFKHSNIASFVRQLNMYGFRKIVQIDQGGLRLDKDEMEFAHPFFLRDHDELLENIKRKAPTAIKTEDNRVSQNNLQLVLEDVQNLKAKQDQLTQEMTYLREQNHGLWRQVATLKLKHDKQSHVVNKLIRFLAGLISGRQPAGRMGLRKRAFPLMINDSSHSEQGGSQPKIARQFSFSEFEAPVEVNVKEDSGYTVHLPETADSPLNILSAPEGVKISEIFDPVAAELPGDEMVNLSEFFVESPGDPNILVGTTAPPTAAAGVISSSLQQKRNMDQPVTLPVSLGNLVSQHVLAPAPANVNTLIMPSPMATNTTTIKTSIPSIITVKTNPSNGAGTVKTASRMPGRTHTVRSHYRPIQPKSSGGIQKIPIISSAPTSLLQQQPERLSPLPTLHPKLNVAPADNKANIFGNRSVVYTQQPNLSLNQVDNKADVFGNKVVVTQNPNQAKMGPAVDISSLLTTGRISTPGAGAGAAQSQSKPSNNPSNALLVVDPSTSTSVYNKELDDMGEAIKNVQELLAENITKYDWDTLMEMLNNPDAPLPQMPGLPTLDDNFTEGEVVHYNGPEDLDSIFNLDLDSLTEDDVNVPLNTPVFPGPMQNDSHPLDGLATAKMEELD